VCARTIRPPTTHTKTTEDGFGRNIEFLYAHNYSARSLHDYIQLWPVIASFFIVELLTPIGWAANLRGVFALFCEGLLEE
jgi:hypothetical protein